MPIVGISGRKRKNRTCACVHGRCLVMKPFRTWADRYNDISVSLLLLVAVTKRSESIQSYRKTSEGNH